MKQFVKNKVLFFLYIIFLVFYNHIYSEQPVKSRPRQAQKESEIVKLPQKVEIIQAPKETVQVKSLETAVSRVAASKVVEKKKSEELEGKKELVSGYVTGLQLYEYIVIKLFDMFVVSGGGIKKLTDLTQNQEIKIDNTQYQYESLQGHIFEVELQAPIDEKGTKTLQFILEFGIRNGQLTINLIPLTQQELQKMVEAFADPQFLEMLASDQEFQKELETNPELKQAYAQALMQADLEKSQKLMQTTEKSKQPTQQKAPSQKSVEIKQTIPEQITPTFEKSMELVEHLSRLNIDISESLSQLPEQVFFKTREKYLSTVAGVDLFRPGGPNYSIKNPSEHIVFILSEKLRNMVLKNKQGTVENPIGLSWFSVEMLTNLELFFNGKLPKFTNEAEKVEFKKRLIDALQVFDLFETFLYPIIQHIIISTAQSSVEGGQIRLQLREQGGYVYGYTSAYSPIVLDKKNPLYLLSPAIQKNLLPISENVFLYQNKYFSETEMSFLIDFFSGKRDVFNRKLYESEKQMLVKALATNGLDLIDGIISFWLTHNRNVPQFVEIPK